MRSRKFSVVDAQAVAQSLDVLISALDAAKLSKSEVARRLGTSRADVGDKFRGTHAMTVTSLARILDVCGLDLVIDWKRRKAP